MQGRSDRPVAYLLLIVILIVSKTKFSIVIGSLRAYLSHNQHTIMWVSNLNFFLLDTHVIRMSIRHALNGFLRNVLFNFQNLGKVLQTLSLKSIFY